MTKPNSKERMIAPENRNTENEDNDEAVEAEEEEAFPFADWYRVTDAMMGMYAAHLARRNENDDAESVYNEEELAVMAEADAMIAAHEARVAEDEARVANADDSNISEDEAVDEVEEEEIDEEEISLLDETDEMIAAHEARVAEEEARVANADDRNTGNEAPDNEEVAQVVGVAVNLEGGVRVGVCSVCTNIILHSEPPHRDLNPVEPNCDCGHLFHEICLRGWFDHIGGWLFSCPVCRAPCTGYIHRVH